MNGSNRFPHSRWPMRQASILMLAPFTPFACEDSIELLARFESAVYEDLNQIQHEAMVLQE